MSEFVEYAKPPVTEVAMSVQFDAIEDLRIPHLGLIWDKYRARFPNVEQHGPISTVIERVRPSPFTPGLSFSSGVETPRVWFLTEDEDELVQIQNNRFARNWRKQAGANRPYPHYEPHIRPSFLEDLKIFEAALRELGFGGISINQCELTYVNRILPDEVWSSHRELHRVLNVWSASASDLLGSNFESAGVKLSSRILSNRGEFLGRMHFDMQPSYLIDRERGQDPIPIFACNIVARGQPISSNESGVVGFFDLVRSQMIRLFETIFTDEIQASWGKGEVQQ